MGEALGNRLSMSSPDHSSDAAASIVVALMEPPSVDMPCMSTINWVLSHDPVTPACMLAGFYGGPGDLQAIT